MGSLIQKPETTKTTTYQQQKYIQFASSRMKGWKPYMQDTHLTQCPLKIQELTKSTQSKEAASKLIPQPVHQLAQGANIQQNAKENGMKDLENKVNNDKNIDSGHGLIINQNSKVMQKQLGDDISLFAVFDGHLGTDGSIFVQRHFPSILVNNQHFKAKNYQKALYESFMQMDRKMRANENQKQLQEIRLQQSKINNSIFYAGHSASGTTANVILVTPQYIYCANAGDSRSAARLQKNPKSQQNPKSYIQLSFDHKPKSPKQQQRIQKAGAYVDLHGRINHTLNVCRGFGDYIFKGNFKFKQQEQAVIPCPDIIKISKKLVKFIIMGSDGIWERRNCQQMTKWVDKRIQGNKNRGLGLQAVAEEILENQLASGCWGGEKGFDNMTVVLIRFKNNQ